MNVVYAQTYLWESLNTMEVLGHPTSIYAQGNEGYDDIQCPPRRIVTSEYEDTID